MKIRADRLFRCTGCGGWRYRLNQPCQTCRILANRKLLRGTWGQP
jgi:hypothetical protein